MTQVTITTDGHTVTVEHDGSTPSELARIARKLWRDTHGAQESAGADGIGFRVASIDRGAL